MAFLSLGKYKAVMVAIGLFLLFVAGVFALNYYMARQFSTDTAGVNLAGQQGTQSERIIKNLLLLENRLLAGEPIEKPLESLKATVHSFEGMLNGLVDGEGLPIVRSGVVAGDGNFAVGFLPPGSFTMGFTEALTLGTDQLVFTATVDPGQVVISDADAAGVTYSITSALCQPLG